MSENIAYNSARKDIDNSDSPTAVAFSPLGDYVFIALQGNNSVVTFDAYSLSGAGTLDNAGLAPRGMAFDSRGHLFVHGFLSRSVSVYDVSEIISGNGQSTKLAEVSTVASETLTPEILLGKQVFYNAADVRMGGEFNYMSCATCHSDGGHDGRTWDFTDRGEGFRNTTSLRGRRGDGHGPVHWSANFDEIHDFENDIRGASRVKDFLTDQQFSESSDPLGSPKIGLNSDLDALAAYVASLSDYPRSPHRSKDGSLTADGIAGEAIFKRLDCASCHSGNDFTDSAGFKLHDVGTLKTHSGNRLGEELVGIDTPTLRGWNTAPIFMMALQVL